MHKYEPHDILQRINEVWKHILFFFSPNYFRVRLRVLRQLLVVEQKIDGPTTAAEFRYLLDAMKCGGQVARKKWKSLGSTISLFAEIRGWLDFLLFARKKLGNRAGC